MHGGGLEAACVKKRVFLPIEEVDDGSPLGGPSHLRHPRARALPGGGRLRRVLYKPFYDKYDNAKDFLLGVNDFIHAAVRRNMGPIPPVRVSMGGPQDPHSPLSERQGPRGLRGDSG